MTTTTDPIAVLARIRQMADYWEQHLPDVIRTPAVVSAIRAALERADAVLPEPAAEAQQQEPNEHHTVDCTRYLCHANDHYCPPPPADRADLRDRIAAAIWERQNPGRRWADCEYRWRADAEADADAVLTVLPDRAAVLREAADRIDREDLPQDDVDMFDNGARWATKLLRRMAGETPATTEAHACGNCEGVDPDTCLTNPNRPAAGARQDGGQS